MEDSLIRFCISSSYLLVTYEVPVVGVAVSDSASIRRLLIDGVGKADSSVARTGIHHHCSILVLNVVWARQSHAKATSDLIILNDVFNSS